MKTNLLVGGLLTFLTFAYGPQSKAQNTFIKAYGTSGNEFGERIIQASNGDFVSVGRAQNTAGNYDLYIQRTDKQGVLLWQVSYDRAGAYETGNDIKQTPDGGFIIVGETTRGDGNIDYLLVKTTSTGAIQWTRSFDGKEKDHSSEIIITPDGGYLITGWATDASSNPTLFDPFIVKTNSAGGLSWAKMLTGNSAGDALYSWVADPAGGYIGVGFTFGYVGGDPGALMVKINDSGTIQWAKKLHETGNTNNQGFFKVIRTSDGNFVTMRALPGSSKGAGDRDIWLYKFTSTGTTIWSRVVGTANYEEAYTIQETSDQGFIIAGTMASPGMGNNALLIKTNSLGVMQWSRSIGSTNAESGIGAMQTSDGNMVIQGSTSTIGNGQSDLMLVVTDAQGNVPNCKFVKDALAVSALSNAIVIDNISLASITITNITVAGTPTLIPTTIAIKVGLADLYRIEDLSAECSAGTKFCVNLLATRKVDDGIIGMDYCLNYDANLMTPTGNGTLGAVVTTSTPEADFMINTQDPGKVHVSIFYKASAPRTATFNGKGSVICIEFQMKAGVATGTKYTFTTCELSEDFATTERDVTCVSTGDLTVIPDTHLEGKVIYNNDPARPLIYNNAAPNAYPLTSVSATGTTCTVTTADVTHTDGNGDFVYDVTKGNIIKISRNIQGTYYNNSCMPIQKYINGQDALLAELIATQTNTYNGSPYRPTAFQMVSADVNMNDHIRANDVTWIMLRSTKKICEFPQEWNYTLGTTAAPFPPNNANSRSYDWLFIDKFTYDNSPAFVIDGAYPYSGSTAVGYWRDNVPDVPVCLPVRFQTSSCPGPINEVYYGMLLGDVNGNWSAVSGEGIRTSTPGSIIVDLNNSIDLGNGYFSIPVTYSLAEPMTSLDFNLAFDKQNLEVLSIDKAAVANMADMRSMYNIDESNHLYFISYTLGKVNSVAPVFYLNVYAPSGQISEESFSDFNAYVNGEEAMGKVVARGTTTATPLTTQSQQALVLKPNPANTNVTIDYAFANDGNHEIRISNIMGVTVSQQLVSNGTGSAYVSLENLMPGVYNCQLIENGVVSANEKLVINK